MDDSLAVTTLVVFGILFLLLGSGVWIGFALFMVGYAGLEMFGTLPAGYNMASSLWATASSEPAQHKGPFPSDPE